MIVNLQKLLECRVHYGHIARRWNPNMKEYLIGKKNGIHVIDLRKTLLQMQKSYEFIKETASKGGKILFVGTKRYAKNSVKREAFHSKSFYVNNRWLGGTLTNFDTIRRSIYRLKHLDLLASEKYSDMARKDMLRFEKEREKLSANLSGIREMKKIPAGICVVDVIQEKIVVQEARKLNIPIVAMVDTNADPRLIDYPIPGNDDSIESIELFISIIGEAIQEGNSIFDIQFQREREEKIKKEQETFSNKKDKTVRTRKIIHTKSTGENLQKTKETTVVLEKKNVTAKPTAKIEEAPQDSKKKKSTEVKIVKAIKTAKVQVKAENVEDKTKTSVEEPSQKK